MLQQLQHLRIRILATVLISEASIDNSLFSRNSVHTVALCQISLAFDAHDSFWIFALLDKSRAWFEVHGPSLGNIQQGGQLLNFFWRHLSVMEQLNDVRILLPAFHRVVALENPAFGVPRTLILDLSCRFNWSHL